jgi:hypothetical protein
MAAPKMVAWLQTVADGDEAKGVKADPGKAVDLVLKAAEYHIPKLARTEMTGPNGGPVQTISRVELAPMNGNGKD